MVCSEQAIFTKALYQVLDGSGRCATALRTQPYALHNQLVHSLTGSAHSNILKLTSTQTASLELYKSSLPTKLSVRCHRYRQSLRYLGLDVKI